MTFNEEKSKLRTWIEIDKKALKVNYNTFRKISDKSMLCAVVKSNAYGHGLTDFAKEMQDLGVDWFAVDSVVEGLKLRESSIQRPILVLGYTLPARLSEASANNISVTVSTFETLKALTEAVLPNGLNIHIKIDTGMHRQGFQFTDKDELFKVLGTLPANIKVEGVFTHFAMAKNPAFPQFTKRQISEFEIWRAEFLKSGFKPIYHASASAAAILYPEANYDMIRVGMSMYGHWPAKEVESFAKSRITLAPALSWKAVVSEVKAVSKGESVGYDCAEKLMRDSTLAIVPIGYWHGYDRALSSVGYVLVNKTLCKVVGRVSMDMIVLDVTDAKGVSVGDEVELLGTGNTLAHSAEEVASMADSNAYEFLTRLNPLIKKFYI